MSTFPTPPLYTSTLSISYSPHPSPLKTLDLYHLTPTTLHPLFTPSYNLLYIHGGAFRDPLCTSLSLLPSLPSLFSTSHIDKIASLNYRLSPYPHHPTHPSSPNDDSRNRRWPDHIDDVRDAIRWLLRSEKEEGGGGGWEGKEWIICGHSVGATMAVMLGMEPKLSGEQEVDYGWGREIQMSGLRGVVGIAGIYDFTACRDAHGEMREFYDAFIGGAFGREEEGGWNRGDVMRCGRRVEQGVGVVVLGHSREDELVEEGQTIRMIVGLEWEGDGKGEKVLVELEGRHQDAVEGGAGIAECVGRCVDFLVGLE